MVNVNYNFMTQNRDVLFNVNRTVVSNANILGLIKSDIKEYQLQSTFDAYSIKKVKLDEAKESESHTKTVAKALLVAGLALLGAGIAGLVLGGSGSGLMVFGIIATTFGGLFTLTSPLIAAAASTSDLSKEVNEEERKLIDLANLVGKIKVLDPNYAETLAEMNRKHPNYEEYGEVHKFMDRLVAFQERLNK